MSYLKDTNMFLKDSLINFHNALNSIIQSIRYDFYIFVTLLLLSILGISLTDAYGKWSKWYWLAMVPVFFGCNLLVEWQVAKIKGIHFKGVLIRQIQSWLGLLGAFYLTFFLEQIGSLNNETTGMILLLILSLAIYIIGVTGGWLFQLLGVFLGLCLVIVAYVENYTWVILGLSLAILAVYIYLSGKFYQLKNK